jgi:phosphoglycolate phosphatase-like HAD superfamily hydrolase
MKYTDYIWDVGGTLMDNYQSSTKAFKETLGEFDLTVNEDEIYEALKVSTDFAIEKFAVNLPDFKNKYQTKEAVYLDDPVLFSGVIETLNFVINNDGRNFIISHRNNQTNTILKKTGIASLFTEVVTSENGFPRKPKPDSIEYLKDKYQMIKPVMIGDREIDIESGIAAGIDSILFGSDVESIATYQVDNIFDITKI